MAAAVLLFLFVAYQLWGTGLEERRGQRALRAAFQERLVTSPQTLPSPAATAVPTTVAPPDPGDAVALLEIPRLGLEKLVVEGVSVDDLKRGPGHYPGTALPGAPGNAAIAGHRTTYGAPFYRLNELEAGDPIFVTTLAGRFRYDVRESLVVSPEDGWVLDSTADDRLTLTTCHPRFSAAQRLIVFAGLATPPVAPLAAPSSEARPQVGGGEEPVPVRAGLSGEVVGRGQTFGWAVAAGTVWGGAWAARRLGRRWLVYGIAVVPFLFTLLRFFESVAALLPANM